MVGIVKVCFWERCNVERQVRFNIDSGPGNLDHFQLKEPDDILFEYMVRPFGTSTEPTR